MARDAFFKQRFSFIRHGSEQALHDCFVVETARNNGVACAVIVDQRVNVRVAGANTVRIAIPAETGLAPETTGFA